MTKATKGVFIVSILKVFVICPLIRFRPLKCTIIHFDNFLKELLFVNGINSFVKVIPVNLMTFDLNIIRGHLLIRAILCIKLGNNKVH